MLITLAMLQLLPVLRTRSFELDGVSYEFNKDGDINLGYDISLWRTDGVNVETLNVVSHYQPSVSSLNTTTLTLVTIYTETCLSLCLSEPVSLSSLSVCI